MKLINLIQVATENKPSKGEDCNSCGWCCLTEVCPVGMELSGTTMIPCKLLTINNDTGKHTCSLVDKQPDIFASVIGAGEGCCAQTQQEILSNHY